MKGEKVTREDVLRLSKRSGRGIMDCKKALNMCDNDEDAAFEYLREHEGVTKLITVR